MKYMIKGFDIGRYDCDTMFIEDEAKNINYQVCIAKGLINMSLIDTEIDIENIFNGVINQL